MPPTRAVPDSPSQKAPAGMSRLWPPEPQARAGLSGMHPHCAHLASHIPCTALCTEQGSPAVPWLGGLVKWFSCGPGRDRHVILVAGVSGAWRPAFWANVFLVFQSSLPR